MVTRCIMLLDIVCVPKKISFNVYLFRFQGDTWHYVNNVSPRNNLLFISELFKMSIHFLALKKFQSKENALSNSKQQMLFHALYSYEPWKSESTELSFHFKLKKGTIHKNVESENKRVAWEEERNKARRMSFFFTKTSSTLKTIF